MADRIAVMNRGRIEQVASPTDIYDNPATLFVNQFVGTTNLIPGKLVNVDAGGCDVQIASGMLRAASSPALLKGMDVLVSVRPEQWRVERAAQRRGARRHRQDGDAARSACGLRRGNSRRHLDQDQSGARSPIGACWRAAAPSTSRRSRPPPAMSFTPKRNDQRENTMTDRISRRDLLGGGAALGAAALLPSMSAAQGKQLVAATFPGTWNEAHRQFLAPAFTKRTGASVTQSILLGNDQLSRLTAAKGGKPPFDVALFDRPQVLDAAKQGLIVEYPAPSRRNYKDLLPEFQDKWGPCISMQVIGIGYNPKKIKTPPKSWDALWDPQYKGRVGLTALNSQLGIAFLAEINRLRGGNEENFEPAFKALRELLPECRRDRRQSRRLRDALAAGADRHRALQLQLRADAQGQGRAGRARDPGHRRGRLDHQHACGGERRGARSRGRLYRHASRSGGPDRDAQAAL